MKVHDTMSSEVRVINPDQTIKDAAAMMCELDCGALPVGENDRLIGIITDRDIATRAVAQGMPAETQVRQIMSGPICYCYDDQDVNDVADNMAEIQVRRLPVVNRDKQLIGIISLGDIARGNGQEDAAVIALSGISRPNVQQA